MRALPSIPEVSLHPPSRTNRYRLLLIALIWLSGACGLAAQHPVLKQATEQLCYGGFSARCARTYDLRFQISAPSKRFAADTLWVGSRPFAVGAPDGQATWSLESAGMYRLLASYDTRQSPPAPVTQDVLAPQYDGVARLTYHIGRKRYTLTIPSFTKLPDLAMP